MEVSRDEVPESSCPLAWYSHQARQGKGGGVFAFRSISPRIQVHGVRLSPHIYPSAFGSCRLAAKEGALLGRLGAFS